MQKRIIVSIIAIVIILTSLASCTNKDMLNKDKDSVAGTETVTQNNNTSHDSSSEPDSTEPSTDAMTEKQDEKSEDSWVTENKVIPEVMPKFVQGDMKVLSPEDALEVHPYKFTHLPMYRDICYWEPWFLYNLVEPSEWDSWCTEIKSLKETNNTDPEEIYVVSFVKHFHISKEDFEKASEKRKHDIEEKYNGEYLTLEPLEIFNADIIYTFDNEIINAYYRRDICTYTDIDRYKSIESTGINKSN